MIKTTIIGFGDSLTYGYGVERNVGFMDRLDKFMPQYFPFITWNILNKGANGDTTKNALFRLKRDVLNHNPNIVLILFGSNDASLDYHVPLLEFKENLTKMLTKIKKHNNRTGLNHCIPIPVLITPPPVIDALTQGFIKNSDIEKYRQAIKQTAEEFHCPCVDFFQYLKKEKECEEAECFQPDGVHLSAKGYDLLYDCVFSAISRLIDYEGILKDYDPAPLKRENQQ